MKIKSIITYAPAFAWGIFVLVLSTIPGKDIPKLPDWSDLLSVDKLVHMAFYAILTWLILRGGKKTHSVVFCLAVAALSATYGWLIEWIQETYCEDRLFEVLDGVANTIGAITASLIFIFKQRLKKQLP